MLFLWSVLWFEFDCFEIIFLYFIVIYFFIYVYTMLMCLYTYMYTYIYIFLIDSKGRHNILEKVLTDLWYNIGFSFIDIFLELINRKYIFIYTYRYIYIYIIVYLLLVYMYILSEYISIYTHVKATLYNFYNYSWRVNIIIISRNFSDYYNKTILVAYCLDFWCHNIHIRIYKCVCVWNFVCLCVCEYMFVCVI